MTLEPHGADDADEIPEGEEEGTGSGETGSPETVPDAGADPGEFGKIVNMRLPVEATGDVYDMAEVIRYVMTEGNTPVSLFRNAGALVRLGYADDGRPLIMRHDHYSTAEWVARRVRWTKTLKSGAIASVATPEGPLRAVMAAADELADVPVLERVSHTPFFLPDGALADASGYHPASRAWYHPSVDVPEVSRDPTADELSAAVKLITVELLGDFPFASACDRAGAVALLLEPFVRDMIAGNVPLHLIDAPTPGTGKSLLAHVCTGVATGEVPTARLSSDDQETRKLLTSKLAEGRPVIFFDNVSHYVDSDALAQALTQGVWSDRMLGKNSTTELAIRCSWVMTSNNVRLSRDFPRRISLIRLDLGMTDAPDAVVEAPETRDGFRHPDIGAWGAEHRAELVWAALTVVAAWVSAGLPQWSGKPLGSFESWSKVVGGVLQHAGIDGFLGNRTLLETSNAETGDEEIEFLEAWWSAFEGQPVKTKELFAVNAVCGDFLGIETRNARGALASAGSTLGKMRDRLIGGFVVKKESRTWRLSKRVVD